MSRIGLNWSVFTATSTGAARRAYELHRRMPGNLDFVAFVTGDFSRDWKRELPGFSFVEVAECRSAFHRIREGCASFWRRRLKETGCSVWVTDTLPVPSGLHGFKTCLTVHDLRYLEDRSYVSLRRYLLLKWKMGSSLRNSNAVVAVSSWTGRLLTEHYSLPVSKVSVIPNAVDPVALNDRECPGSSMDGPYVLSVGHLERRKNMETLVRAFGRIADSWSGSLVIVGRDQGSKPSIDREARRAGVSSRLKIIQDLDYSSLARLYRECEMVVCPSVYEGFGITLLEGMAAGSPVIASDIPPHREVAGEAALYITPLDDEALSAAMRRVLGDDDLRDAMARKGRERVACFSWDSSAEELAELYRRLLQSV